MSFWHRGGQSDWSTAGEGRAAGDAVEEVGSFLLRPGAGRAVPAPKVRRQGGGKGWEEAKQKYFKHPLSTL